MNFITAVPSRDDASSSNHGVPNSCIQFESAGVVFVIQVGRSRTDGKLVEIEKTRRLPTRAD